MYFVVPRSYFTFSILLSIYKIASLRSLYITRASIYGELFLFQRKTPHKIDFFFNWATLYTLPTDQLFNLEFQFESVFNLEFQPKFGIQLGIPISMGINLGKCSFND